MAAGPDPPPPDAPDATSRPPAKLPTWHTPLIGRERELEQVLALARRPELPILTITGPGGAGKTRLAVAAATVLAAEHDDGVVFVPLAPVRDPAFVMVAIARAAAVSDTSLLADHLRDRDALLVLDNVEHVLAAAPAIVGLLQACPALRALATSRTRLNITGEVVFPLAALEPDAAVTLFAQRAHALDPAFRVTDTTAPVVAAICARLDGLPLAIELAAARSRLLAPRALLALLTHRLDALAAGPHDAPTRQRTLRGTIDWSHDLLGEREQAMLRRLAVFAGGFALDAAEAVAGPEGDALDALAALIDSNLVRAVESPDGTTRYQMLETIREYALERLVASGEETVIRERHARHYLGLAESLESAVAADAAPVAEARVRRLYPEPNNLRGALAWLLEHDPAAAARLASALDEYWFRFGYFAEGRVWLDRVLAAAPAMPAEVRRRVLDTSGWLAYQQGDLVEAEARMAEAVAMHRASGDPLSHAWTLGRLANVALARLEPERAGELLEEARQIGREIGSPVIEAAAIGDLGRVRLLSGDIEEAEALLRESVRRHRLVPGSIGTAVATLFLGSALLAGGKMPEAAASYRGALATFVDAADWANVARCVEGIARAVAPADPRAAARLFGGAAALRARLGHPVDGEDRAAVDRAVAETRERLAERPFAEAWAAGQALEPDAVVREAMAGTGETEAGAVEPDNRLSAREEEVLALLVAGHTDAEIAAALAISRRTAATHLRHIYDKLGVSSRAEAAAVAIRRGLA
jgi:predicted ATPase/DNA-binding CsgD family transcriptional regulator